MNQGDRGGKGLPNFLEDPKKWVWASVFFPWAKVSLIIGEKAPSRKINISISKKHFNFKGKSKYNTLARRYISC